METLLSLFKVIPILIAAIILGNWFLAEVKKGRHAKAPWYAPYVSLPGLLIITIVILIPVLMKVLKD